MTDQTTIYNDFSENNLPDNHEPLKAELIQKIQQNFDILREYAPQRCAEWVRFAEFLEQLPEGTFYSLEACNLTTLKELEQNTSADVHTHLEQPIKKLRMITKFLSVRYAVGMYSDRIVKPEDYAEFGL